MKKYLLIAILLFSLSSFAQQGTKNFLDIPYVEVVGKKIKEVTPDKIYLKIIVSEKDKGKKTVEQTEREMIKKLKSLGVNIIKDFSIKDFSSKFKRYFLRKTDIQTLKEYELIVHSGKMAAKVFQGLESIGISNISITKLRNSKIEEIKRQAKIDALKNAKQKAEDIGKTLGQDIGKALYVRESNDYNDGRVRGYKTASFMNMSMNAQEDAVDTNIEFEKIRLEYSVTVRFELKWTKYKEGE